MRLEMTKGRLGAWVAAAVLAGAAAPGVRAEKLSVIVPTAVATHLRGWNKQGLTHWNQEKKNNFLASGETANLYNRFTPSNVPCGCVATAGAAVLEAFAVPSGPPAGMTNPASSYNGSSDYVVNATLGGSYDWSILPEWKSASTVLNDAQRDLIGRVVKDLGIAVGMKYGALSWANPADLASAFRAYYGLNGARFAGNDHYTADTPEGTLSEAHFAKLIYAPLRCNRPVVLSIHGSSGGHAAVAVGYAEYNGKVWTRLFLCSGGNMDAWYTLPDINCTSTVAYTLVKGAVTLIGREAEGTIPIVGRVLKADGSPAPCVPVEINGRACYTSPLGLFGLCIPPAEYAEGTSVTVTVAGRYTQTLPGKALPALDNFDADALCAALPDELRFTLDASEPTLTVKTSLPLALSAAKAASKPLFILRAPLDSPAAHAFLQALYDNAATHAQQPVLCLIDENLGQADWQSLTPQAGLFDPRFFSFDTDWEGNRPALIADGSAATALSGLLSGAQTFAAQSLDGQPIPRAWLANHFTPLPESDAALQALVDEDSDGDGYTNAQEYLLGTLPTDPASTLRFAAFAPEADGSLRPVLPELPSRACTLQGKAALGDAWGEPEADSRFFRLLVDFP